MAIQVHDPNIIYHKKGGEVVVFVEANQDTTDATYQYFGYINSEGNGWLIQRFHTIALAVIYEYAAGRSITDYLTHWDAFGIFVAGGLTFSRIDQLMTP